MKKLPIFATMLLVMGVLLVPSCDEQKPGTDPLVLAAIINNSQYYLEFDVDLDNDGTDDEHVEMGMRQPFDLDSADHWYQCIYANIHDNITINIPDTTPIIDTVPITYNGSTLHFKFSFYVFNSIKYDRYSSYADHDFTFSITKFDGIGGKMNAEFSGELSDNISGGEKTIMLSNGIIYSRINK